jgi:hypothetical protein
MPWIRTDKTLRWSGDEVEWVAVRVQPATVVRTITISVPKQQWRATKRSVVGTLD